MDIFRVTNIRRPKREVEDGGEGGGGGRSAHFKEAHNGFHHFSSS